jgi:membrane protein YdbS with pleckstrin-like domain
MKGPEFWDLMWKLYLVINIIIGVILEFRFDATRNKYYKWASVVIVIKTALILFFVFPFLKYMK